LSLGAIIPLAINAGMTQLVPWLIALSLLSFLWGALIVEILRAVINRISTTVYRRTGRLGIVLRLTLLIVLFVAVQLAFNPYILYYVLAGIVSGISLAWFVLLSGRQ